jgi:restriction system protein
VLVFNSVLALVVSVILVVIGFVTEGDARTDSDLSNLFKDGDDEKKGATKLKSPKYTHQKESSHDETPNWAVELFQQMDWKRYEDLCSAYFIKTGFKSELTNFGADEGIDIYLYENNMPKPIAIVQCKSWSNPIGVNLIREFVGVMTHKKVSKGYFMTTSNFYQPAIDFARLENVELICGKQFIKLIRDLPVSDQQELFSLATNGDHLTPTCSRCGVKMVYRNGKDVEFWGCRNYPKCKSKLSIKKKLT